MDRTEADAIATALLGPATQAQQETRRALEERRARESQVLANKRRVAIFMLVGVAVGAVAGWVLAQQPVQGVTWGGLAGAALGWLSVWLRPVRAQRA